MRRIYVKIWLALVVAVFVSLCGGAVTGRMVGSPRDDLVPPIRAYAVGLAHKLPEDDARRRAAIETRAEEHGVVLTLYDTETDKSVAYTWTDPGAQRIGMNLGWAQVGLTREPGTPHQGFDSEETSELVRTLAGHLKGTLSSSAVKADVSSSSFSTSGR